MLRSCVQLSDCSDVVMDLRDNPGGMVGLGIDVASMFLPNGAPFATIVGPYKRSQPCRKQLEPCWARGSTS
jgi:C-terminal processing protease CtpA/Prc